MLHLLTVFSLLAAAWLVSSDAAYINGQTITIDGGSSAGLFMPVPPKA